MREEKENQTLERKWKKLNVNIKISLLFPSIKPIVRFKHVIRISLVASVNVTDRHYSTV